MKWLLLASALLLTGAERPDEPHPTPARWQQPADRLPLPRNGMCPGSFEIWTWDKKRDAICVRRA